MDLIDSHCHLDDDRFAADRAAVLARARTSGVGTQIIPAITAAWWPRLRALCAAHDDLFPAYGLHPLYLAEHRPAHIRALERWLEQEPAVAVGECGLDYYVPNLDREAQADYFQRQLAIADNADLPVIIHARRATDEVLKYIRRRSGLRGVIHSFVGSEQQARQFIERGFYLGFGGTLTYPRAQRLRRLAQILPLHALLLETDAPDQPLSSHRGERNEPAYLPEVLAIFAELRATDPAQLAAIFSANTRTLFNLDECYE